MFPLSRAVSVVQDGHFVIFTSPGSFKASCVQTVYLDRNLGNKEDSDIWLLRIYSPLLIYIFFLFFIFKIYIFAQNRIYRMFMYYIY